MAAPGERETVDVSGGRGLASLLPDSVRAGQSPARKAAGRQAVGGGRGLEKPPGGKNSAPCPQFFTRAGNIS